jgi:hypothetical protein
VKKILLRVAVKVCACPCHSEHGEYNQQHTALRYTARGGGQRAQVIIGEAMRRRDSLAEQRDRVPSGHEDISAH